MIDVPGDAYKKKAQGDISDEELSELEKFADALDKEGAFNMDSLRRAGSAAESVASHPLGIAAGVTSLHLAAPFIAEGARAVRNKLTYKRDLNNLLGVRPEIKDEHEDRDIDLAFQSIRTLNPDLAKDPLTGSTLLKQVLRNRDIHDPSAPPRMDLGVARELYTAERRGRDPMTDSIQRAFQAGTEGALQAHLHSLQDRRRAVMEEEKDTRKLTKAISGDRRTQELEDEQRQREQRMEDTVRMKAIESRLRGEGRRRSRRGMSEATALPEGGFSSRRAEPADPREPGGGGGGGGSPPTPREHKLSQQLTRAMGLGDPGGVPRGPKRLVR